MSKARPDAPAAPPSRALADIRRPTQQRSRDRFEAILDGAERLLETLDPSDISIHKIAAEVDISAPSIYHFFPEAPLIFGALAERYLRGFEQRMGEGDFSHVSTWQELQTLQFRAARDYFNSHAPVRKVLLGPALSFDIRTRDLNSDAVIAAQSIELLHQMFEVPPIPQLLDRWVEIIVINDAVWALSIHRHGQITDEMEEQARRARIAYARTFLPEYLPRRAA
ncbi:TetR/AcrR family transcriptional regulator [Steroidobacter sp.]|uniref:TetR/AcrR family transcriptional regulator n=1 Tax=Steroidobacter sp. TaxID=1978227 RepID=UPI001A57B532|nr:TetR/AcrR family transcriptional regulator [Steroidobacter sp.]MBL8271290.1 TetR/AcrR family transcriptional regulator [Steroidobacter sp.]